MTQLLTQLNEIGSQTRFAGLNVFSATAQTFQIGSAAGEMAPGFDLPMTLAPGERRLVRVKLARIAGNDADVTISQSMSGPMNETTTVLRYSDATNAPFQAGECVIP